MRKVKIVEKGSNGGVIGIVIGVFIGVTVVICIIVALALIPVYLHKDSNSKSSNSTKIKSLSNFKQFF